MSGCSVISIGEEPPECAVGATGVDCVSAREVWAATDTLDSLEGMTAEQVRQEAMRNDPSSVSVQSGNNIPRASSAVSPPPSASERAEAFGRFQEERLHMPSPDPLAVREAPGILRVTIAPYHNELDHLVMPTQLFAEVETRKWTVGKKAYTNTNRISPTAVRAKSVSTSQLNKDQPNDTSGLGIKTREQPKEYDFEGVIPQNVKSQIDAMK
ncbi:TraV family lipoprotein [Photobacterium angustum]|uniref:TraV family lipoprotein n=1 Tax=Photobacterium angustum TaxID=661 RepID=UPI001364E1DD|nr:TraV family lipoprotein [Photobacterium angustum]